MESNIRSSALVQVTPGRVLRIYWAYWWRATAAWLFVFIALYRFGFSSYALAAHLFMIAIGPIVMAEILGKKFPDFKMGVLSDPTPSDDGEAVLSFVQATDQFFRIWWAWWKRIFVWWALLFVGGLGILVFAPTRTENVATYSAILDSATPLFFVIMATPLFFVIISFVQLRRLLRAEGGGPKLRLILPDQKTGSIVAVMERPRGPSGR